MKTFAGIASEELKGDEAALLGSLLSDGSVCENSPLAVLGAEAGASASLGDSGRRVTALFSGRLENASELYRKLAGSGHELHSTTPAELVLHLYEKYGCDAFSRLRGSFAAAVYDSAKHRLLLGRDVIGIEPLYYFIHRNVLVFSNRLPILAGHPLMPDEPDINAIGVFLSLQYIPAPDTVYRGVRKLPPGHLLEARLDSANTSIRSFGKIDFSVKRREMSFADACAGLRERVENAVCLEKLIHQVCYLPAVSIKPFRGEEHPDMLLHEGLDDLVEEVADLLVVLLRGFECIRGHGQDVHLKEGLVWASGVCADGGV